uniref:FCP1 homology domain-containing protein n=1 Tax=viral metagenome TaxID=1070528 RepID=A0A6C0BDN3_9ZZZZ
MKHVGTFRGIDIESGDVVFCDIDDTLFDYGAPIDNYWKEKIEDPGYKIWYSIIENTIPTITDKYFYDFLNLIRENNAEIYFITARNVNFKKLTVEHLKYHSLEHIECHCLSGTCKSKYISENFDLKKYNRKIFIDDSEKNIADINDNLNDFVTYLYKK